MLADTMRDYIHAGCSGIWVETREPDEAEREIQAAIATNPSWKCYAWDITGQQRPFMPTLPGTDPLAVVNSMSKLAEVDTHTIVVLHNFHRFLNSGEMEQAVFNQLLRGKTHRVFMVVLAPISTMPLGLEKLFVVLEHDLPNRDQLAKIASELDPTHPVDPMVLSAAMGLTRYEAEAAFALSLARTGEGEPIKPEAVWELKQSALKKQNLLTLHRGKETFANLGGMESVKKFCTKVLRPGLEWKPRGILLLGVSGTGKSAFAKALGNEVGRPTLLADPGSWKASLVGETGQRTRQAFKIADAMAPVVLFIDEIEKALAGASGAQGDSGVSADQMGTMLTWLNDHTTEVFTIATCNDIRRLPPEFSRAERWDAVFFLDLPTPAEKDVIWHLYRQTYKIGEDTSRPDDSSWTGAEIKACCRLAALLEVPLKEAAKNVVPVAITSKEQIDALRSWASGRCCSASRAGIYGEEEKQSRRAVTRN